MLRFIKIFFFNLACNATLYAKVNRNITQQIHLANGRGCTADVTAIMKIMGDQCDLEQFVPAYVPNTSF